MKVFKTNGFGVSSERASHELSRPRLKEGATINRSLATLGNVINALAERSSLLTNGSYNVFRLLAGCDTVG